MSKLPPKFKSYFWDTNLDKIDLKKHQNYIIERLLELGDLQSYQWLKENYPPQTIEKVVNKSRQLSEKTRHFWRVAVSK